MAGAVERFAMWKPCRRRLPFLLATYLLACVGRINIGFAAPTVQGGLHMSASA